MVDNEWVLNGYSYWIESKIGEGQFGTVHKGRNESGTVVAIKENKASSIWAYCQLGYSYIILGCEPMLYGGWYFGKISTA
jgi:hypothetical protein